MPSHPESPPGGPAWTTDDLIDFHVTLSRLDWFDQMVSLTVTPADVP